MTQEQPPPPDSFVELAAECRRVRSSQGLASGLWTATALRRAHRRAVIERGYPETDWSAAVLLVAVDPTTRSPMRVAEAGPWWDAATPEVVAAVAFDLTELEVPMDALDGQRVRLQQRARAALEAEGIPLTRASVLARAVALLDAS